MTCRKVRETIPLLAGADASPRRTRRAERHCAACPACRRELAAIRAARDRIRAAAAADRPDIGPAAWAALMAGIAAERPVREPAAAPRLLRARPAVTIAVIAMAAAAGLFFRGLTVSPGGTAASVGPLTVRADDLPLRIMGRPEILVPGAEREAARPRPVLTARREAPPPGPQDVISITLVSEGSGLQVNWVFNRDFEWKGDRQ